MQLSMPAADLDPGESDTEFGDARVPPGTNVSVPLTPADGSPNEIVLKCGIT